MLTPLWLELRALILFLVATVGSQHHFNIWACMPKSDTISHKLKIH